jgi:hypothetical protein
MYFGAKTAVEKAEVVKKLPLLLEVATPSSSGDAKGLTVTARVPALPLKPLLEDSLKQIFNLRG